MVHNRLEVSPKPWSYSYTDYFGCTVTDAGFENASHARSAPAGIAPGLLAAFSDMTRLIAAGDPLIQDAVTFARLGLAVVAESMAMTYAPRPTSASRSTNAAPMPCAVCATRSKATYRA